MRDVARPPLPAELSGGPVNDAHGVGLAEADHQIAFGRDVEGVLVRPFLAAFQEADAVFLEVQVFPRVPFVDYLPSGCNLPHRVPQHTPVVSFRLEAALDLASDFLGQEFPGQDEGVAVGQPLEVMVQEGIAVLPDHVAVPIKLTDGARYRPAAARQNLPLRAAQEGSFLRRRAGAHQQVAAGQQVGVVDAFVGVPGMADTALHVYEAAVVSIEVGDQGVAPASLLGRVVDQAVGVVMAGPAHGCLLSLTKGSPAMAAGW